MVFLRLWIFSFLFFFFFWTLGKNTRTNITCISCIGRWHGGKEATCQCRRRKWWFNPWVRKIPWSREWQPVLVFLPGKFSGQRSLAGYSPWGHKDSDITVRLTTYTYKIRRNSCESVFLTRKAQNKGGSQ